MKTWKFFGIVAATLLSPTFVAAQHGHRHCPPQPWQPPPCPPGYIVPPSTTAQPPTTTPPGQEAARPPVSDERGQLAAAFAERDVAGVSSGYRSGAPNVIGNQLANNCLLFSFSGSRSGGDGGGAIRTSFGVIADGGSFPRTGGQGNVLDPLSFNVGQVAISNLGIINVSTVMQSSNPLSTDNGLFSSGSPIPLASPNDTGFLDQYRSLMESNFGPGTLTFVGGEIVPIFPPPSPRDINSGDPFDIFGEFDYFTGLAPDGICITPPGSLIGRYKVSENNSPIPRDRAFFSYNFFSGTPLGKDVNRFTPGLEKTFLDGTASVELRLPFASTLNGDLIADDILANGTETRLGNLQLALKGIVYQTDSWLFSIGMGVTVPTAEDINADLADGTPLLRFKNEAWHLQPFIGYLYAPDQYFYFQGFSQIDIDVNRDSVYMNLDAPFGNNLQRVGRLRDRTLWSNDLAVGYWLYRDSCSFVSGIAPQLELHYDQTLDHYRSFQVNGITLAGGGTYSSVAVTGAVNIEFNNDATLTLATSLPVTDEFNRGFDWELLIQFNYRFGASASRGAPGLAGR